MERSGKDSFVPTKNFKKALTEFEGDVATLDIGSIALEDVYGAIDEISSHYKLSKAQKRILQERAQEVFLTKELL